MHRSSPPLAIALLLTALGSAAFGIAAIAIGALAAAPAAHAQAPVIYKWVDENGVAHYTTDRNRIPAAIRDRVIQGGDAARGSDWLRRDAGPAAAAPLPGAPAAALPGAPAAALPTAPVAPAPRQAEGVELPEDSDGVHAVQAEPDWSEAPGGERQWAPGELGEEGEPPAAPRAAPAPPPVEAAPAAAAARPAPPPPPPLEADGAPVTAGALPAAPPQAGLEPIAAPAAAPAPEAIAAPEPEPIAAPAPPPPPEPTAPAAVAAPAPRHLAPDEQAELAALDAQIAEVEARIARDEEALMVLISEGDGAPRNALVDDPRFRDIAQRLPKLQADLERLRERRAQIQPVVSRP